MQKFLRTLTLLALIAVPWVTQGQNARVSEYDGSATTATYSTIVGTTGATAWTAADQAAGYVDIAVPFAMYFGENQVLANSMLRVYDDGSATFESVTGLENSRLAPLYYASGYTTTATSVYTKSSSSMLTVEWRKVVSGSNSYSFQLKLYSNGEIEFCYGPMTLGGTLSVFTGLMSSSTDVFRARGEDGTLYWNSLERATDYATRTLSSNYYPEQGTVYTFTQPACVKPTGLTATATAWNTIDVEWTVSSNGNGYEVKYSTNPDFNPDNEGSSKTINNGATLTTTITGLTGSTTYYFYVRKMCGSTPSGWSPMATATTLPGCYNANMPSVNSEGVITWTSPNELVTSYNVKYGLAGFNPETEGTAVNNLTALTYTLPVASMASATAYDIYLQANCSASGLTTDWVGPVVFNTPCGAVAVGANNFYTQNFEGYNIPMCWSEEVVAGSDNWGFSGNGQASFIYTPDASSRLITPIFNLNPSGAYQVEFYHSEPDWSGTCDSLWLCYRTSATGEWVRLAQYGNHSSSFAHETVLLPNPTANYQLAFVSYGMDGNSIYLANVVVRTQPTCPAPTGLAATAEGVLTWTAGNNNTSYDIVYGPAGITSVEEGTLIQNVTGTTYALANLEGSTSYDAYIRAHCSATSEISEGWVGPASFTTPCMAMAVSATEPFSEDFEGTTLPACWSVEYVSGSHDWVFNSYGDYHTSTGTHSGSHNALFRHTSTGSVTKLVSPVFNFASGNYSLSFWHIQRSWSGDIDNLKIYYRTSPSGEWTLLESYTGAIASWTQEEISLLNTNATYQIAFEATDNYGYGVGLDDITIVKLADCLNPVGLAASGVTATAATLTWTPRGTATQWEVKVGARGFNPDEEGTSYTVNTTPTLALDYLYMVTEYDAYVRAICDPEGPTEWSNVCEFKTPCANGGNATIGNGTSNVSGVPVYSSYGNTFSQMIFTAEELTAAGLQAGNIAGMTFTWNNNSTAKEFSIYIGHTEKATFSSKTDYVDVNTLTQVYGPTAHPTGTSGEVEYTFTTPFTWDGTSNIVVSTFMNQPSGVSQSTSGFTAKGGAVGATRSLYRYRDSYAYTPDYIETNQNGSNTTSGSTSSNRPNVTFIAPCDSGSCNAPQTAIALSETEYAATLTFTDVNEETNPSYGIVYGPQGFDPATAGTTVSPINASNYTISGLAARTSYDVYVYAICSGTNGRMVKYNFVTPFIPNCKTPIIDGEYGASNIAYNTATLTWRQPGSQPMFWTVRYADADFDPATAAATDYTELTIQGTAGATAQLTGLVAGTTYYVYIKATCSTAPDLDESPWLHMSNANPAYTFTTPACVEPTNVVANDVTNSTAMISWTEAGVATAWTVKYGPAGFDPDNEGTAVAVTADSVELTGLDAYTAFDVYVKANCTATDESDWSSVCTFLTVCPDGGDVEVAGITAGRSYYIPVNTFFNYSYTQQIITAEEIPGAGAIQGISLSYYHTAALDPSKYDVTIYIGTTDKASFASSSDFVDPATLTAVWHGTFNVEQGWNNFIFDTPFMYDGSSNIVVAFDDDVTGYNSTSHMFNTMTTSSPMTLSYHSDTYNPDATSAATLSAFSGNKTTYSYRNVMKLMANCNTDVTCFAPASISADVTPANVVTLNWAPRTDLRPVVNNYELKYGMEGFNPETQGVLVPALNNVNTYIINADLAANTNYDVYVRTVCGENDHSKWTKASFTTYPTCWIPVDLTVTGTTSSSATLSWANDSLAPSAATRWEVCYGPEGFGNPEYYGTKVETTNNAAFTVEGLKHTTKYEFYVRAICSATDKSEWSTMATGTTQCGVWAMDDLPLTENFDGVTGKTSGTEANHVLPNCWDYNNDGTYSSYVGYPICYNSSSYSRSGNNHLRFYTNYSSSTSNYGNQIAIFPPMNFDVDTLNLEFYARKYSTSTSYQSNIIVGVMSDPDDASTFEAVATLHPTGTAYEPFLVEFSEYQGNGRYIAIKAERIDGTSGYNYVLIDDVTLKVREKINTLPNNGGAVVACNEFVMPDTTGGSYAGNLNTTYVIRPAQAGYVARIQGDYDLENGYDFLNVYRGAVNANNLVGRYTGTGSIDYMTSSNLWADSGYVTLVLTSDADNAFANTGFKFLVSCEQPMASEDTIQDIIETNGTYTWTAGNGLTYTNHSTMEAAPDLTEDIVFPVVNVAGFDSVYRHLALTLHPTYELNYAATICERDTFEFYGQTYTTAGEKTVTLQSVYGADSVGILNLTVNSAPSAFIQYNNRTVTAVADVCDNSDMTLNARSNVEGVTFLWEDSSTAAIRVVNPHESNTYTVVAVNSATGCTSLPATVTVTTTPVPVLTISGDSAICYGQSATLTLADANNVPAAYRWSTNATTESITVNPTTTTTYTVTATSTTGACVATAEFTVTVNALPVVEVVAAPAVICQNDMIDLGATYVDGYSYMWNTGAATHEATVAATTTGNYTVTVTDQNGCVNEFTTNNVTVHPVYELNDEQSACVGMLPYAWGTLTLSEAGSYDQTFQTVNGCDSTIHLTFIVQDTANNNSYRELCEGAAFTFGTGIYEQAYTATTSTVISYVDTTSGECPARYNLNLTVNTHNPATVENTVCDSYTWPLTNETYTVSGAYVDTLKTVKGCDSVVTLNLTVNYQNTGVDEQTACDSYEWIDGNIYTASNNTATHTLQNVYGCDSVVTLNLTVNYRSYHEDFHRVCDAPTYTWDDNEVYELDVELEDSIQHITGENAYGCLEIALLHLDLNYVSDHVTRTVTACDEYIIDTVACDNSVATAYLRESGIYTLRVHNDSLNRDEILTLNLTVNESSHHTTVATECLPYTWTIDDVNGDPFEIATITADMVNGASVYHTSVDLAEAGYVSTGCSTIEVLRLTPKYPTEEVIEAAICQNGTWYSADSSVSYNGADLNLGLNTMTWKTSTNAEGCQHLDKVALTVNPLEDTTVDMTYCENQFVNGTFNYIEGNDTLPLTIDVAGLNETVYTNTLVADWTTENGCARTVTVNYTVNPITTEVETVQALTEYMWKETGKLYKGIGHHTDTVVSSNVYGCTLYKVLDLEITDSIRHYDTITVCTQYQVEGVTYYEDNTFSKVDDNNEVWYTTYHVAQRTLNEVNVVSNQPYTWINGETYTANASNVYYSVPAPVQGECDDVYKLNFTMVEPIVICEGQLPYQTVYGFSIDAAASDVYTNATNDTIIAYTVNLNTLSTQNETACDSYTWHDSTYTASGAYTFDTINAAGCDSTITLNLTINASTVSSQNVTACDSYTWHGNTYVASGSYTFDTINADGCDSTATLVLTINKNNGIEETLTACDSYTWNGVTFTADTNVTKSFNDVNGCAGDSILHLTVKNTVFADVDTIVNEASVIYMGVLYNAPLDTVINDTVIAGAANGCDSITRMHLQLNMGNLIQIDTVYCGDFTWVVEDSVIATYTWIPMAERTNPIFNYKNMATNQAVDDFPVYETYDANGIVQRTYVLHLTMQEARTGYKTETVLLSRVNDANYMVDGQAFDFTAEKAAKQNATKLDTIHYGAGSSYCDSIVYYTFNLVYNYVDDDTVTVCYTDSVYTTQNNAEVALAVGENAFTDTTAAGTANEMVHNKVYVRSAVITGTETIVACDSTTWNNTLFTANVVDSLVTLTADNSCDSIVTLNITITPTVHNVIEPADICDSYTWSTGNNETYTSDTVALWSRPNATDAQCVDVDTLKLVVKHSTTGTDSIVACDTYDWIDGNTYTVSNTTATHTLTNAAGCDSVVTLNLTVNYSFTGAGNDIDTLGASVTLTDQNGSYIFLAPYDDDITLVYQTVAGCDSTVTFNLTVNQFQVVAENPIECGIYTWDNAGHGTGHTYKWISNAEKSEHTITIPGISPMVPLYKDITADVYVYSNPLDTVGDIVYLLNLNLNEAEFVDSNIARFPQSVGSMTLHGKTFDFSGLTSASKPTADTTVFLTLPNATLCGTVMQYNVHVVYNYTTDAQTVCFTDTYTWEDNTTSPVTVGSGNTITKTLFADNWDSLQVVTRTITVRANNNTYSFDAEACDSYTWNDSVYTTTGAYAQTFTDQYGCDSIATLNLTVKYNTNNAETIAACDSTQWNGTWYKAAGVYTYEYTALNGCASVDTLNLTINHNEPQVVTESACDSYTWSLNSREYTTSGTFTANRTDAVTGCQAVDTLELTIRKSTSYDSVMFVTDGSYHYSSADTSALITAGNVGTFAEHYTNAAQCDSILNIEIHVGSGYFAAEDVISCNNYTWRDGNTYVWISAEERAANGNALYKNQTTGAYVMSNPIYNVANNGDYDSIYMLRLNLTQNYTEDFTIDFPISLGTLTYGDSTFNFETTNDEGREFVNTTVEKEVHFASNYYCDSIHYLTINLQNNYSEVAADAADICVTQSSYTWRGHEISTATTDYDHAHIYYVYDTVGTAEAPVVEYIKVTQHPVVYATERRTACDSYVWNDSTYTVSTSSATFDTVDMWGCDSTVTLMLTIYNNSSMATTLTQCDSFSWMPGDGQTYTYTESGDYLSEVYLTNKGCESRDTLHLTVNYTTNNAYTVDVCDSYTWNNMTLTASCDTVYAYTNTANCPSVDTLHLTIRNSGNQGYTQMACDSYVWHDSTYTASGDYLYEYTAENECPSVDTLHLTINVNNGFAETLTVCDSIDWNGHKYFESGEYTVHYADANGCEADSVLTLTVNNATHNSETIIACDLYTWHGVDYTTSGVKTYEYDNLAGCASVDTLHLTIHHSDYNGENYATMTVSDWCGDYTWVINGETVGVYTESVETSTSFVSPETGCDSVVFLNLTIKNAPVIDTTATVCENTLPYMWRGKVMSAAGVETVAFPLENGCDSTIRFTLNVNPKYETVLNAEVCLGSGYNENEFDIPAEELPEVGEYTFQKNLTSEFGCDSIVYLTINVKTLFASTVEATACESYTWNLNNVTYAASGNYDYHMPAVNGCDSVVTLALTINTATTGVDVQTACNRYTWMDGNTYYENNNTATFTLVNAAGCDSIVTLDLTVNYSNNSEFDAVACDSYTWNGAIYNQSGDYTYAGTNVDGCDSVVTMHLTINQSQSFTQDVTACGSYTWTEGTGQTYSYTGTYLYSAVGSNGCDSVTTLNLIVNKPINTVEDVEACESYVWNGETYTTSGTYTHDIVDVNGCDAVATLNLTINTPVNVTETVKDCDSYSWNGNVYTESGFYTYTTDGSNGCDSVTTLILTINASSTSNEIKASCGEYEWNGQTYNQTGVYTYTTTNAVGCDSTVTLSLVINQNITTTETATACNSYEWNGNVYTESGVYTFNGSANGCDSIATLLLTIKNGTHNAETVTACDSYTWNGTDYAQSGDYTYNYTNAAGCASTDTLHLTINASTGETVNATACDSYTWTAGNGQTYTTSGNYAYQTTNAAGCDHIVTLALTINTATSSNNTMEACNSYTWNGNVYNQTGIYTYQTTNANGCDSVATLALTIKPSYTSTENQTACGSYTWHEQNYITSGTYTFTTTAANGCDSVMNLNLTINNPVSNTVNVTACDSYIWTGATDATYTTSGTYTYTTAAASGCDSIVTLHLTINPATTSNVYAESCSSYTWNGQTYSQSGIYTYQTTNAAGCDSTVTLQLNIMQPALTTIDRIACDSYTWNGQTYTASGNYTYSTSTTDGCDSTVVLVLTINNSYNGNIAETACSSYSWNGQTYTTSGNYTQVFAATNGCDSTVTLALTINSPVAVTVTEMACSSYEWNGEIYTTSGVYTYTTTGANGCDSVTTLNLTINQPVAVNIEVSAEGSYSWNGNVYTESGVYTYTTDGSNGCDSVTTLTLTVIPVYTVTLVSSNSTMGSVSESGSIVENGYFTAEATANEGYIFVAWVNGNDTVSRNATYVFQVTEDVTLTAIFVEKPVIGIEDVDMDDVTIYSADSRIFVRGAEGKDVYVYDVNGRVMYRELNAPESVEFRMTATGVYLVKVGNAPAKRVVVVR